MRERVVIGLADGAACDGVDAALVRVIGRGPRMRAEQLAHVHCPYPGELRQRLAAWYGRGEPASAGGAAGVAAGMAALGNDVARAFAAAGRALREKAPCEARAVAAVGCSGHVIPLPGRGGGTLELGAPAVIARELGLPVVSGFAASDLAAGGGGTSLTAWPDWRLLRDRRLSRVAVHLGGVARMTFVGSAAMADDVLAQDVGPGTMVIDQICRQHFDCDYDVDGALAARGRPDAALLNELLSHGYFRAPPPKSLIPSEWGGDYLARLGLLAEKHRCGPEDLLATATELTARAVADAVGRLTERPHEVVLSGGGALNIHLAGRIRAMLCPCSTYSAERYGPTVRGKRAAAFAVLAAARLDAFAAHCPAATGAARKTLLGSVTLP